MAERGEARKRRMTEERSAWSREDRELRVSVSADRWLEEDFCYMSIKSKYLWYFLDSCTQVCLKCVPVALWGLWETVFVKGCELHQRYINGEIIFLSNPTSPARLLQWEARRDSDVWFFDSWFPVELRRVGGCRISCEKIRFGFSEKEKMN